jgi:hypothetical protein
VINKIDESEKKTNVQLKPITMITAKLPSRRRNWSNRYCKEKQEMIESREQRKKQAERDRKSYIPQFVASSTVDSFVDREEEIEPVPYSFLRHGRRNKLCSFCTKNLEHENDDKVVTCDLCPAVAHQVCSNSCTRDVSDYIHHFTDRYLHHIQKKKNDNSTVWSCRLCSTEICESIHQEQERLRIDRFNRTAYFSAVKLQAGCMRNQAQLRYKVLYNGMLRLQARVRSC